MSARFELVFAGGPNFRYSRLHDTYEAAEAEAARILAKMPNRAAHPAIIYGPGCGRDGRTIP